MMARVLLLSSGGNVVEVLQRLSPQVCFKDHRPTPQTNCSFRRCGNVQFSARQVNGNTTYSVTSSNLFLDKKAHKIHTEHPHRPGRLFLRKNRANCCIVCDGKLRFYNSGKYGIRLFC